MPDQSEVTRLKKEKLRVKEEIERVKPPSFDGGMGIAATI
jgi:hypothetical protein